MDPPGSRLAAMTPLNAFGALAVGAMLLFYTLESRFPWAVLAFAAACLASSGYGFLQGAWPFGVVELLLGAVWPRAAGGHGATPPADRAAGLHDHPGAPGPPREGHDGRAMSKWMPMRQTGRVTKPSASPALPHHPVVVLPATIERFDDIEPVINRSCWCQWWRQTATEYSRSTSARTVRRCATSAPRIPSPASSPTLATCPSGGAASARAARCDRSSGAGPSRPSTTSLLVDRLLRCSARVPPARRRERTPGRGDRIRGCARRGRPGGLPDRSARHAPRRDLLVYGLHRHLRGGRLPARHRDREPRRPVAALADAPRPRAPRRSATNAAA